MTTYSQYFLFKTHPCKNHFIAKPHHCKTTSLQNHCNDVNRMWFLQWCGFCNDVVFAMLWFLHGCVLQWCGFCTDVFCNGVLQWCGFCTDVFCNDAVLTGCGFCTDVVWPDLFCNDEGDNSWLAFLINLIKPAQIYELNMCKFVQDMRFL